MQPTRARQFTARFFPLQSATLVYWLALAAVIVVGVIARLNVLNQPMRYDESYTVMHYVALGIPTIVSDYSAPNNHVLYNLLVYLSASMFGFSPVAIRLPALLAGIACIPATYALGIRLSNRAVGVLAAALVATSSILIEYSTNGRGYTLQCLLVLLLIGAALRLRDADARLAEWRGYSLIAIIGLYVLPTMLFPLAAISVWLALCGLRQPAPQRTRRFGVLVGVHACIGIVTVLLYLPILLNAGISAIVGNQFVRPVEGTGMLGSLMYTLVEWLMLLMRGIPLPLLVLFCIGTLLGFHSLLRQRPLGASPLLFLFAVSVLGAVLQRNGAFARTWLYLLPPLFLICASGLDKLDALAQRWHFRHAPFYLTLLLLLLTLFTSNAQILDSTQTGVCPSAQAVAAALDNGETVDTSSLALTCDAPIDYYRLVDGTRPTH